MLRDWSRGGYLRRFGKKGSLLVLLASTAAHLSLLAVLLFAIYKRHSPLLALAAGLVSAGIFVWRLGLRTRRQKLIRHVQTHEEDGINISLYEDWVRNGYELRFAKSGIIRKKEFLPWKWAPRFGMDVEDVQVIEQTTDKILKQLR
jgi:hypothetical protein